jgi:hypothetical protein
MNNARLLDVCERYYRTYGTLPLHLFQKLVAAGFIVTELTNKWEERLAA